MDDQRFGRAIRALRRRRGLRQVDVARRAGVPQSSISLIESGRIERLQVGSVRAVARAVGAQWDPTVRWRGGELDRLIDEGHAALVGATARRLTDAGWDVQPELTFSVYGERGSIDIVAFHAGRRMLLVVEVKTVLASLEETLRRHDAKRRLAPRVVRERLSWDPAATSGLLVLGESSTARRRVARHAAVLGRACPLRGVPLGAWLIEPSWPASGLMFLSPIVPGDGVRLPGPRRSRPKGLEAVQRAPSPPPIVPGDR